MNRFTPKTCCFTGHRNIPLDLVCPLQSAMREKICSLLSEGVIYYGVGGAVGFDSLAAETLFELRLSYPQIKVILVYPFDGFNARWTAEQRGKYDALLPQYDKRVCVSRIPGREAYLMRNRRLVDQSSHCIAFCERKYGGTAYTVRYAQSNGCQVYNLASSIVRQDRPQ